jgi:kynurenine formamidase
MSENVLGALCSAIASGTVVAIDLTQPLSEETPVIRLPEPLANTRGLSRTLVSEFDDRGPWSRWYDLQLGEHVGTHFDAPRHWITGRDGEDVASVPPSRLIGPACVIDKSGEAAENPDYRLTVNDVKAFESEHGPLPAGCWVLLRTGWAQRVQDPEAYLTPPWPGPDVECARWLVEESPIVGFGVETVGTDAGMAHEFDPPYPAHHFLSLGGKYGLTQLANLDRLPPVGATIVVAPLRLVGGTGSPTRAFALVPAP